MTDEIRIKMAQMREELKQRLKVAQDKLDNFVECRLSDTETYTQIKECRAAVEAVLRFGRSGTTTDPCIDLSKTPTYEFVAALSEDSRRSGADAREAR